MSGHKIRFGDIQNVQVDPRSLARECLMRFSVVSVDMSEELHTISQAFQVQISRSSSEQHMDFERRGPERNSASARKKGVAFEDMDVL